MKAESQEKQGKQGPILGELDSTIIRLFREHTSREFDRTGKVYRSPLWDFVRGCKAALSHMDGMEAFDYADRVLSLAGYSLTDVDGMDFYEEAAFEFVSCWDKVSIPLGASALDVAHANAKEAPIPDHVTRFRSGKYRLLLALARELQKLNPEAPIFLPTRSVASLLQISHVQVSRYCHMAVREGFLILTKRFARSSRMATEYRVEIRKLEIGAEAPAYNFSDDDIPF